MVVRTYRRKSALVTPLKYLTYLIRKIEQDTARRWPLILSLHARLPSGLKTATRLKYGGFPFLCEHGKGKFLQLPSALICPPARNVASPEVD